MGHGVRFDVAGTTCFINYRSLNSSSVSTLLLIDSWFVTGRNSYQLLAFGGKIYCIKVPTSIQSFCTDVYLFQYGLNTDSGAYTREACFKGMNG